MGRMRKPPVSTGEIVFTPGTPFINGKAPRARSLSAAFLTGYQQHFEDGVGQGIFDVMYEKFPVEYFWGLVTLAKVMKLEVGKLGDFDKPSTPEEALIVVRCE